jgi:hypothetical protein
MDELYDVQDSDNDVDNESYHDSDNGEGGDYIRDYDDDKDFENDNGSDNEGEMSDLDSDNESVNGVIEISDEERAIETRTLKTIVECWTRTGFKYTTYRNDEPIYSWVNYEDDYSVHTLK